MKHGLSCANCCLVCYGKDYWTKDHGDKSSQVYKNCYANNKSCKKQALTRQDWLPNLREVPFCRLLSH